MKERTVNFKKQNRIKIISIISTCLAAFFALWLMVEVGDASLIDDPVRNAVISTRSDWLTPVMKAITYMGNWQTITVICLILLAFRKTRLTYGVPLSIGALFVSLANKGIKAIVMRPRPDQAMFLIEQGGWSFPSGHSITSMFFYGMAIWLIRRNVTDPGLADILTVLLAIPMVLIGVSRVYLGVHYPTDVLAGWCLGVLVIAAIAEIIKRASNDIK
ncbi:MAG: phosphatase PAP2 family protein [Firmicutes bacterium]|nr:phosphatase PAP2 family protein [Bacillota bacterium]